MKRRTGRILFATAVAAMALLAPAGTANAGLLSQSAGPCPSYPIEPGVLEVARPDAATRSPPAARSSRPPA